MRRREGRKVGRERKAMSSPGSEYRQRGGENQPCAVGPTPHPAVGGRGRRWESQVASEGATGGVGGEPKGLVSWKLREMAQGGGVTSQLKRYGCIKADEDWEWTFGI